MFFTLGLIIKMDLSEKKQVNLFFVSTLDGQYVANWRPLVAKSHISIDYS